MDRRLNTMVFKKNMAKTAVQARQFIAHGHIAVKGRRVSSPSYLVKFNEEDQLGWYKHAISLESKASEKAAEEPVSPGISDAKEVAPTGE